MRLKRVDLSHGASYDVKEFDGEMNWEHVLK
jgi:hypothetical protein